MIVDYNVQKTFTQSIDIVDAGNTCIRCTSANFCDYLIFTKSVAGKTKLMKVGPVIPDITNTMIDGFDISYKIFNYNIKKLAKEFDLYINDSKKAIVNVEEITESEGYEEIPQIAVAFEGAEE